MPATVTSGNYTDVTAPASAGVLYRVRARVNGAPPIDSAPSNQDFTHTWTLPALSTGTTIRALHVTGLRTILNQITDTAGLSRQYSDEDVPVVGPFIDDSHLTSLMTKINIVRNQFALGSNTFTVTPAPATFILKSQIENLRTGLQ